MPDAGDVTVLKFDFTSPASENGFCGYGAITVFGNVSAIPSVSLGAGLVGDENRFVMNISGLYPGWSYILQCTTNLAPPNWSDETNFIAAQAEARFTNSTSSPPQKFYRLVGN